MKVFLVDPWGDGRAQYLHGLTNSLQKYVNVYLLTSYGYCANSLVSNFYVDRVFFKKSNSMKDGVKRTIVRGIEYIVAYLKIIKKIRKERPEIVHFQWLLLYPIDLFFLRIIARYSKIVYTAHNVIPHVNGEEYIYQLRKIYALVDCIFVHGEDEKWELLKRFPQVAAKVYIHYHGVYENQSTNFNTNDIEGEICIKYSQYRRKWLFFGHVFFDKGIDRILNIWMKEKIFSKDLLIIAGKRIGKYVALDRYKDFVKNTSNILWIDKYIDDNTLNYLISNANIILLPYRKASMSGVIFTAAEFKKTILCTDVGCFKEYVGMENNAFICSNEDEKLFYYMKKIVYDISNEELEKMGSNLYDYIHKNFSWDKIALNIVNVYQKITRMER